MPLADHRVRVEDKVVRVRPGAVITTDAEDVPDEGHRYRWACGCGLKGGWRKIPTDARLGGDQHLARNERS